jgi:hypothetical protein
MWVAVPGLMDPAPLRFHARPPAVSVVFTIAVAEKRDRHCWCFGSSNQQLNRSSAGETSGNVREIVTAPMVSDLHSRSRKSYGG